MKFIPNTFQKLGIVIALGGLTYACKTQSEPTASAPPETEKRPRSLELKISPQDQMFLNEAEGMGANSWYIWQQLNNDQKIELGQSACIRVQNSQGTGEDVRSLISEYGGNPNNLDSLSGASAVFMNGLRVYCNSLFLAYSQGVGSQLRRENEQKQQNMINNLNYIRCESGLHLGNQPVSDEEVEEKCGSKPEN